MIMPLLLKNNTAYPRLLFWIYLGINVKQFFLSSLKILKCLACWHPLQSSFPTFLGHFLVHICFFWLLPPTSYIFFSLLLSPFDLLVSFQKQSFSLPLSQVSHLCQTSNLASPTQHSSMPYTDINLNYPLLAHTIASVRNLYEYFSRYALDSFQHTKILCRRGHLRQFLAGCICCI